VGRPDQSGVEWGQKGGDGSGVEGGGLKEGRMFDGGGEVGLTLPSEGILWGKSERTGKASLGKDIRGWRGKVRGRMRYSVTKGRFNDEAIKHGDTNSKKATETFSWEKAKIIFNVGKGPGSNRKWERKRFCWKIRGQKGGSGGANGSGVEKSLGGGTKTRHYGPNKEGETFTITQGENPESALVARKALVEIQEGRRIFTRELDTGGMLGKSWGG